jgi:hypothetical protein
MAIRHVWSEDGRSPTQISLGEPRVAELISRAARDRTLPLSLNETLLRCAQHADRIEENVEEKL